MEKRNQDEENQRAGNRNQNPQNQGQPGSQGQGENRNPQANQDQGANRNQPQGANRNQDEFETGNQGASGTFGQAKSGMQNQEQAGKNIGQWQAWTQPEGNVIHLHVTGSIPTDAKNQNFTLKPAASQGTSNALILELDHEGINAQGKEMASIREFDLPLGAQKYDSVIIRSKGINNVATLPINLRNPKA